MFMKKFPNQIKTAAFKKQGVLLGIFLAVMTTWQCDCGKCDRCGKCDCGKKFSYALENSQSLVNG